MRNRKLQRIEKRKRQQEERLDSKTAFGISDPTPRQCVDEIIRRESK